MMASPAPWKWIGDEPATYDDRGFLVDADGKRVLSIDRGWESCDDTIAVNEHDAKLIAAAPDMLAMLLEIERLEDEASVADDRTPLGQAGNERLAALLDRLR